MYQALSRFTVLQATESWAGPGNEANSLPENCLEIAMERSMYTQCESLVASSQALSSKTVGGESLVTFTGKVVDFHHLALVVPIRLQNKTMCTCDILSTQQKVRKSKMNLWHRLHLEGKQCSDLQKRHKSREDSLDLLPGIVPILHGSLLI